jgi:single-stranded-DNA-specific exonuclease
MSAGLWIESGQKSVKERKLIRQGFMASADGILISDGYNLESEDKLSGIKRILLADMPFSDYEIQILADQIKDAGEVLVSRLYSSREMEYNNAKITAFCPDKDFIRDVFRRLNQGEAKGFVGELEDMCRRWRRDGLEITPDQLLVVLNILKDLELCNFNKKGKVFDINLPRYQTATVDVSNSPYYLEGLADRRAWTAWSGSC